MGEQALATNISGDGNAAIGSAALTLSTGSYNTATGWEALVFNNTGNYNTGFGGYALGSNTTGSNNTGLGYNADGGSANAGMSNCTLIGYGTGGTNAGSNKVCIGNTLVTSIKGQVGFTTYSDERFKTNIKPQVHGLDFINKLKPIVYTIDIDRLNHFMYGAKADTLFADVKMKKSISDNSQIIYSGFSAQQVEKSAKEINYQFSGIDRPGDINKSPYGLRYTDFIVPLVKAVQELSAQNDSLKANNQILQSQINKLVQRMNTLELAQQECCNNISSQSISNTQTISGNNQPRLEQNLPNPFNNNTIVRYYIPANTSNAQIVVTDISGHTLKNIALETKGSGQVIITGGTLSSGSYIYSLLINGRKIDSKQMVLTK
jgi:hypothetical protein